MFSSPLFPNGNMKATKWILTGDRVRAAAYRGVAQNLLNIAQQGGHLQLFRDLPAQGVQIKVQSLSGQNIIHIDATGGYTTTRKIGGWAPYYFVIDTPALSWRSNIYYDKASKVDLAPLSILPVGAFAPYRYDYIYGMIGMKDYKEESFMRSETRKGDYHYHYDSFRGYQMGDGTNVFVHVGISQELNWVAIHQGTKGSCTYYLGNPNNPFWQKGASWESSSVTFGACMVEYYDSMEGQDDPNGNPSGMEIWADMVARGFTTRPNPQWPDATGSFGWGDMGHGASHWTSEAYFSKKDYNDYQEIIIKPSWMSTRVPGDIPDSYGFHYGHETGEGYAPPDVQWSGNPFTEFAGSNKMKCEWWRCIKHGAHAVLEEQLSAFDVDYVAGTIGGTFAVGLQADAYIYDRWWREKQYFLLINEDGNPELYDPVLTSYVVGNVDPNQPGTWTLADVVFVPTAITYTFIDKDHGIVNKTYSNIDNNNGTHLVDGSGFLKYDGAYYKVPSLYGFGLMDILYYHDKTRNE